MGKVNSQDVAALFDRQLQDWETAKNNFTALNDVKVKELTLCNSHIKVQFNPARIVSSAAKVDAQTLKERKCFLCEANRPAVQEGLAWGNEYTVLINPFPIFPRHLTIPSNAHIDQLIKGRLGDMMSIAKDLSDYILFYNGPKCGASAPDHMHFQAGNKGFMTYDSDLQKSEKEIVSTKGNATLSLVKGLGRVSFVIESDDKSSAEALFDMLYDALPTTEGEVEPMLNMLCWFADGKWTVVAFPRVKHRPSCYFAEGDENLLITPASVDMGGVFITPLEKDFEKVTSADIQGIFDEVCMTATQAAEIVNKLK